MADMESKKKNQTASRLKARAAELKIQLPALYLALKEKDTPWYAKALAALTVGYALSPVDLIPDFIPILGYLDDLIVLPALAALTIRLIPQGVMSRCRERARGMWKDGKPARWYLSLPIIGIWLLILWRIWRALAA